MIGLNQSIKKVFVTNSNTLGTDAVKPVTLADGIVAIVDAKTNLTETTPTVANNPVIYLQQAQPDNGLGGIGVVGYGNTLPNRAPNIKRGNVTHYSAKKAVTGQNEKWEVVDNGGKCDEVRQLYIHLTGILVEQYAGLRGFQVLLSASGPCCDTCNSEACEVVKGDYWFDEFVKQFNETKLPGGIPLSSVMKLTQTKYVAADEDNNIDEVLPKLTFEPALTNVETGECYWNIFPYFAEPIFTKISTYDPDHHNYNCDDDQNFTITKTQSAIIPTGIGDYVKRQEVRSKMRDGFYRSDDPAVRFAENVPYFADLSKTYDVITIGYFTESKVLGLVGTTNVQRDDFMVDIYVESGKGSALVSALNTWVTASNPELSAVSLA